jgi:hypothetical protein
VVQSPGGSIGLWPFRVAEHAQHASVLVVFRPHRPHRHPRLAVRRRHPRRFRALRAGGLDRLHRPARLDRRGAELAARQLPRRRRRVPCLPLPRATTHLHDARPRGHGGAVGARGSLWRRRPSGQRRLRDGHLPALNGGPTRTTVRSVRQAWS